MEAAVAGVVVFAGAVVAHAVSGHGGAEPVVGDAAHDGEAGAAVGAVDERVAVAAAGGVGEFAQAVVAGGGVGGDEGAERS